MSILKQKKQLVLIISVIVVLTLPFFANAAGLVPCGGTGENPCTVRDAFYLIARVTNWLISLAGLYAVFQIVSAGFWMVTTMGNEESITKWRKGLSNAVIGFVLVMMAYVFVNTAVNLILANNVQCKQVNMANPLTYITMDPNKCMAK
jgi:hypothetical protein